MLMAPPLPPVEPPPAESVPIVIACELALPAPITVIEPPLLAPVLVALRELPVRLMSPFPVPGKAAIKMFPAVPLGALLLTDDPAENVMLPPLADPPVSVTAPGPSTVGSGEV
jgi:hypothetical protein